MNAAPVKPGDRFGLLTIVRSAPMGANHNRRWECLCDCGRMTTNLQNNLRRGQRSCGCVKRAATVEANTRHGHHRRGETTSAYRRWAAMLARCNNPRVPAFKDYGGRGIMVCERWRSFVNFLGDMGEPPPGLTLDRIDNDGNYEPGNVRWATPKEQAANRRVARRPGAA